MTGSGYPTGTRPAPSSTHPERSGLEASRRSRNRRRVAMVAIAAIVLVGLSGLLGVRTRTVGGVGGDGTVVTVSYPQVARPGLAAPFSVRVEQPGGFDGQIEIETTASYLEAFDENGLEPDPSDSTSDGETITWRFEPPDGEVFEVFFDARLEPGVQWRRDGTTTVEVAGAAPVSVDYRTWVAP